MGRETSAVLRYNYITPRRAGLTATAGLSCSKEDKILIKNLRQLKGYTATRFVREFKTKNWTREQILTIILK